LPVAEPRLAVEADQEQVLFSTRSTLPISTSS
jgi:hypothetical protein